jgi:hypothetical protein
VAKTKAQLEAENKLLRESRTSEGVISIFNNICKWGAIVLIFRYGYLSVEALSGFKTESNIAIKLITDIKLNQWLAYVIGVGGFVYGGSQNRLKKTTVERLQARIQAFEKQIDPKRSTSKLTSKGETHPEDRR